MMIMILATCAIQVRNTGHGTGTLVSKSHWIFSSSIPHANRKGPWYSIRSGTRLAKCMDRHEPQHPR
ncbi:hypothetical protein KQX54_002031 [Cotesia glomerata]|uniref:Secreted protein n=1 Tax=Cotesia glomerata TaxID=32391 RepID=A0AAV7HZR6_COTGL|nr:hypothetical protein KQX54_002031 [Cotesia glomerata]